MSDDQDSLLATVMIEMTIFKEKLAIALEALEFYGNEKNWKNVNQFRKTLIKEDVEYNVNGMNGVGGLRARQAIYEIKGE